MTLRWGRRSTGGAVKAGHGGWYLYLFAPPVLMYIDPDTGDAASCAGWNLARSRRVVVAAHARHRTRREIAYVFEVPPEYVTAERRKRSSGAEIESGHP